MDLKTKINNLPTNSGCYLYKNKFGKIIYVGKAVNLKNRVKSYFNGTQTGKTYFLVKEIVDVEYIITKNEVESLILELNLIKEHDPKYNILLKDDKSYPYIQITKEKYPKVKITRDKSLKKGELYGPYPNSGAAREMVDLINRNYPLVKCRKIPKKECLYYHINQCLGQCINDVSPKIYDEYIKEVRKVLKGNVSGLKLSLQNEMKKASESTNFERAIELKKMLESVNLVIEKQSINVNKMLNIDVINYDYHDNKICIQLLYIRNGMVIERVGELFDVIDDYEDVLIQYILNMYHQKVLPDEIVIPSLKEVELLKNIIPTSINTYVRGVKSNYLKMAKSNAKIILNKYFEKEINEYNKSLFINEELKNIVGIDCYRIDIFDISHHNGANTVGALVVSKNYNFNKNDYRKFKLSVDGNDDTANTKEVVYRYYYRCLMEKLELPDLIVADGGVNQVNAILDVISSLNLTISVIGLIKDDKHTTNKLLFNNQIFPLERRSELYKFLANLQDEVHRFAIGYHHTIASKQISASTLDNIKGIGAKRKRDLIKEFKSIDNIKKTSIEELEKIVPSNIAQTVFEYFKNEKQK
ncbi:MAG: excinuclease ABC subunit UvrC [Bacilli bacterium]